MLSIESAVTIINDVNGLDKNHEKCGKVGVLVNHENSRASEENYLSYSHSQNEFRNDLHCSAVSELIIPLIQVWDLRRINSKEK